MRVEHHQAVEPAELERIPAPDREFELRLRALEALQALAALRPPERRLLWLRYAGYSYCEIQAIEHRSAKWVDRHLVRGRREVRNSEGGENLTLHAL